MEVKLLTPHFSAPATMLILVLKVQDEEDFTYIRYLNFNYTPHVTARWIFETAESCLENVFRATQFKFGRAVFVHRIDDIIVLQTDASGFDPVVQVILERRKSERDVQLETMKCLEEFHI